MTIELNGRIYPTDEMEVAKWMEADDVRTVVALQLAFLLLELEQDSL